MISIRVSQETAKRIRTLSESSGKSLATLIKENLGTQERKEKKIEKEISKAYNKGADDNKIWYYCAGCRKRINISPNSADHKALIQYMEEHGWGHKTCIG